MQLRDALHGQGFTQLQLRELWLLLGRAPSDTVSDQEALVLWVGGLLQKIPGLGVEQRQIILREIAPRLLAQPIPIELLILALLDGRWVTWHGREGFLDLITGNNVLKPPPCVESIGYNLGVLFTKRKLQLDRGQDATNSPGDLE